MTCVKSTHRADVVPVVMEKHPNADSLSVVRVFGYTCCVRSEDWQGINLAVYIPPDSVVDTRRPEFSFLAEQAKSDCKARVKAKKLRGIVSFGLLIPAPEGAKEGEDWAQQLGIEHYEPQLEHEKGRDRLFMGGEVASAPSVVTYKYDVDAFRRYHHLFSPGEPVIVTEKLDGANSRFVFFDGKMHCGSRTEWKKEYPSYEHVTVRHLMEHGVPEHEAYEVVEKLASRPKRKNLWWEILEKTPSIEKFCRANPGVVLYGESYGNVNCIKYGFEDSNRFAAFDILRDGRWVDAQEAMGMASEHEVPWVPIVFHTDAIEFNGGNDLWVQGTCHQYSFDRICSLAEGKTLVPGAKTGTIREGVVVRPLKERYDERVGRICFKCVSSTYLEKFR